MDCAIISPAGGLAWRAKNGRLALRDLKMRAVRLGIRGRLTLWFVMGAVGAVVIGSIVVYASGLASIQGTLGQTYCQIAARVAGQFESRFEQKTDLVRDLATDVLTTEVTMEENEIYEGRPRTWIEARLSRRAAEWRAADPAARRKELLHPELSRRLSVLAGLDADLIRRLAVYDSQGALIGASNPPRERDARGQKWFRAATGETAHFTYFDLDREAGLLTVVVPVWGGVEIIGHVVAELDYAAFAGEIEDIRFGETGEVLLIDQAGVPLAGAAAAPGLGAASIAARRSWSATEPFWVTLPGEGDWPLWRRLACIAPVPSLNALRARFDLGPWSVVITQSPVESYAALRRSLGSLAVAGIVGVLVVGAGGAFIAWHFAAPLKELQQGVRRFARGDRDRLVEVTSTDEIGELAAEFNRMAERVAASENELRAFAEAVEGATDAIILTDARGVIYYVNPAFEQITGYRRDEARGKTPALLRDPDAAPEVYAEMWDAVAEGRAWRGEIWNRRKNGEVYPVDLSISPITNEHGEVLSLLGIHRDITLAREYRERLEREVEARTREIAETQGLAAMGQMASMIAHDLRNALSTVKMNLQILRRRHSEAGDAAHEHCEMGLEQVGYMEEILRDMLSYARPERLQADWHDVSQVVDEALVSVAHDLKKGGIEVVRHEEKGLPKLHCDRVKMIEVLRNLIDNAILAMNGEGVLTVDTRLVLGGDQPMIQIVVGDNGEGIVPEILPKVLEPFFTTRSKGTGLGLAIVNRIVEQHGGKITVDSRRDEGTRVRVTLPTGPTGT